VKISIPKVADERQEITNEEFAQYKLMLESFDLRSEMFDGFCHDYNFLFMHFPEVVNFNFMISLQYYEAVRRAHRSEKFKEFIEQIHRMRRMQLEGNSQEVDDFINRTNKRFKERFAEDRDSKRVKR
jgi:hypothetical protein